MSQLASLLGLSPASWLSLAYGHCYLSLSLRPFGPAKPLIGPRVPQPLLFSLPSPAERLSDAQQGRRRRQTQRAKPAQGRADLRAAERNASEQKRAGSPKLNN